MPRLITRRKLVQLLGAGSLSFLAPSLPPLFAQRQTIRKRQIPSSGELLPIVGVGTWLQFDVGQSDAEREPIRQVLKSMVKMGGEVIDSSPMYGNAERVIGELTTELGLADHFFYATKVWTSGHQAGIDQMNASMRKMERQTMDLMQVHNLLDWQTHLKTLKKWKEQGKIRYIGITHYTVSSHDRLEEIVQTEDIDFVQVNYSIQTRHAEKSLLKAAQDNGVAVIINQPYEGGSLFNKVKNKQLPDWAAYYDINNWAQFFLKYILSHPAVTCVIPGTSNPEHLEENVGAAYGRLPDEDARQKMADYFDQL